MWGATETCPNCGAENFYPEWDIEKDGYIAECHECGKQIFLCDECLHAEDNISGKCNWTEIDGCGHGCKRGFIFDKKDESKNAKLVIKNNNGFSNDIWQTDSCFTTDEWKEAIENFSDVVHHAREVLGEVELEDFAQDEVYVLGDVANFFDSIDVELKGE